MCINMVLCVILAGLPALRIAVESPQGGTTEDLQRKARPDRGTPKFELVYFFASRDM
ncbi:hypothetical protein HNQ90_002826 [Algibacter amylolyticus]|nr:hypothetical protein [Algibacter amylolyticus]